MEPTGGQLLALFIGFVLYLGAGLLYDNLYEEAITLSLKEYNRTLSPRPLLIWLFFTIPAFNRTDICCKICGSHNFCGGHYHGEVGYGSIFVLFWFFVLIGRVIGIAVYFTAYFFFYCLGQISDKLVQSASKIKF